MAHVELIKPREKLNGYEAPSEPATVAELAAAIRAGQIVWKVAKASVKWRRPAQTRRLDLGGVRIKCAVIGGERDWYFVSVLPAAEVL